MLGHASRPALRYHGGKWKLAKRIIEHFPAHRIYVEPFGGAASVLLQKPRVYAEVYNDLDGEIVNVFRVMRDKEQARELEISLRMTPFSRAEFANAREKDARDPVEAARRTVIKSFMGFGSAACNREHRTGFRTKSFRSGTSPANDWRNYPDHIQHFTNRFQGVCIESRPAVELISSHDREDVLFYVDPPYPMSTRHGYDCYRHEMSDKDHEDLADALHRVSGMVVLSGYRCPLYDRLFEGWSRQDLSAFADGARPRVECLWISPNAKKGSRERLL